MPLGAEPLAFRGLEEAIRATGSKAKIIWVGPPKTSADMKDNGAEIKAFDEKMKNAIAPTGARYVPSSPHTSYDKDSGNDGTHFNAAPARAWAKAVFGQIVNTKS